MIPWIDKCQANFSIVVHLYVQEHMYDIHKSNQRESHISIKVHSDATSKAAKF